MARRSGTLPSDAQAAKARLMDAAEECFDRYGVVKTTMDDIAKTAGVSRPTVYRHFDDRDPSSYYGERRQRSDSNNATVGVGPGGVAIGPRQHCRMETTRIERGDGRRIARRERVCD